MGIYIHAETYEITVIESDAVNADSTIQLIEILGQKHFLAKELILIADNAKCHYSKRVQEALKGHPSLNLIERLWGFIEKHV